MTYHMFGETLNLAVSIYLRSSLLCPVIHL